MLVHALAMGEVPLEPRDLHCEAARLLVARAPDVCWGIPAVQLLHATAPVDPYVLACGARNLALLRVEAAVVVEAKLLHAVVAGAVASPSPRLNRSGRQESQRQRAEQRDERPRAARARGAARRYHPRRPGPRCSTLPRPRPPAPRRPPKSDFWRPRIRMPKSAQGRASPILPHEIARVPRRARHPSKTIPVAPIVPGPTSPGSVRPLLHREIPRGNPRKKIPLWILSADQLRPGNPDDRVRSCSG